MQQSRTKLMGGIICSLAALFYVYDYFVQVAPSVMVNDLMRDFHIGAGDLGILSACFFYAYASMQLPAGWLLDRLGARKLLSLAVLVSACGVLLFSEAPQFWVACLGRFLIGLGSAFAFISTLFLISRWFSHKYFAVLAGFVQLGACIGSIIGLAPIASLVNQHGWRETMWVTGLLTFGLALLFWLVIRNAPNQQSIQKMHANLPKGAIKALFKNKQVWAICACGFLSWVPVAGVGALWGVPYMMKVYGLSNEQAGALVTWFWLGIGLGSPFVGWLSLRLSLRKLPIVLCFFSAVVASILLLEAPHLSRTGSLAALFLLGFSASTQSLTFGILKDVVPREQFGFASGMNNMAAILGGAFAQPLIGFILKFTWNGAQHNGTPLYTLANYQVSLYMLPAIGLLGMLVALFALRETHCQLECAPSSI
ncbi:MAG: MFS transporter [Coxiella sp. (in: Bacteria)]|nr:MAG: MFS transporter [Coxiella sp. (in: g-proteobacteria)]